MAIKKTELYSSLWASCDELRGGMDASQYKDYVLTLLFMKYVSDKYAKDPHGLIEVPEGADYNAMVALKNDKNIGEEINKIISKLAEANDLKGVIDLADFNDEDKLGKGKDMVDRLTKLVGIFQGLDLASNKADGDDLLGDAYEYLMRHFATDSGKSKGQFYTPAEVSRIVSKVVGITSDTPQDATVYDPACGSGSLLLKASDEAPRGLTIFGQEMDNATSALARMNMILHDNVTAKIWQDNTLANPYWKNDDGSLKGFDFAVANPPFSVKSWSNGININDDEFRRFEYGTPPDKNGDYAFLLHILKSLKSTGKGAVILPHGVLFRGNAEARIRTNLIKQGYIRGIIGLPANLFYGTGIPACIIVLDKAEAATRTEIFMIDASKGFMKDGNKNRLRSQDIHKVVDVFTKQLELDRFSRKVSIKEIESNDYNLNIPRYIDSSEPEDLHDLSAHLQGGIPNRDIDALQHFWQAFPSVRAALFAPDRAGYSKALVDAHAVKSTILNHAEFKAFAQTAIDLFHVWKNQANLSDLRTAADGKHESPKEIIHRISERLLNAFAESLVLDKYDIYQIIMDYWSELMQDDVYVIVYDGWEAGRGIHELTNQVGTSADLVFNKIKYKSEIIPPNLIINRFYSTEKEVLDSLLKEWDDATQALETLLEENSSDDGTLSGISSKSEATRLLEVFYELSWKTIDKCSYDDYYSIQQEIKNIEESVTKLVKKPIFQKALNSKSKLTKKNILSLIPITGGSDKEYLEDYLVFEVTLKEKKKNAGELLNDAITRIDQELEFVNNRPYFEEIRLVKEYLALSESESTAKKAFNESQEALNELVFNRYSALTIEEIKTLIVDDKWLASLQASIIEEIERISQQLANRVRILEERYVWPLSSLIDDVASVSSKVDVHLKKMGLAW